MNELLAWVPAMAAGMGLGVIFFGSLWFAVRKGVWSRRPRLWFFGGLLLRMGTALTGFYFVADGHWERLPPCLLGFVMVRVALIGFARPSTGPEKRSTPETFHAP